MVISLFSLSSSMHLQKHKSTFHRVPHRCTWLYTMTPVKLNENSTAKFQHALSWKRTSNGVWTIFPLSYILPFMYFRIAAQFVCFAVIMSTCSNHVFFLIRWISAELLCMLWWMRQTFHIDLQYHPHLPKGILILWHILLIYLLPSLFLIIFWILFFYKCFSFPSFRPSVSFSSLCIIHMEYFLIVY